MVVEKDRLPHGRMKSYKERIPRWWLEGGSRK
jgi:hypothetical protein